MDEDNNYCLELQQFDTNIKSCWQQLQKDKEFCNVTLACDDKQILAHKIVISSNSSILRNILKNNINQHPVIYLRGVRYIHLQNLVNFMYQGAVTIASDDLQSFLEITEDLKIKGLSLTKDDELNPIPKFAKRNFNKNGTHFSPLELEKDNSDIINDMNYKDIIATMNSTNENKDIFQENVLLSNTSSELRINARESESQIVAKDICQESTNGIDSEETFSIIHSETTDLEIKNPIPQIISSYDNGDISEENENKSKLRTKNELNRNSIVSLENNSIISLNNDKLFTCDKCEKEYSRLYHLERHKKSAHDKIRYSCDQCNHAPFKWQSNLLEHKSWHEGHGFQCDQCDHLPFHNSSHLKQHKATAHEGVVHPCDLCDNISFTKLSTLKKHKASVHDGVRYTCDECDHLPYKSPGHLRQHKKSIHEGVCFPCSLCDYKTSHKPHIQRHTKKMHKIDL